MKEALSKLPKQIAALAGSLVISAASALLLGIVSKVLYFLFMIGWNLI